MVKEFLSP
jgi:hypothetical protein